MTTFPIDSNLSAAPRTPEAAGADEPHGRPGDRTGAGRPVVLLVDDDPSLVKGLEILLSSYPYDVLSACSAADAVAVAGRRPPDVLLTDISLFDGDGIALFDDLHRRFGTSGIALTGHGEEEDLRRFERAGFSAWLIKPFELDELERVVSDVVAAAAKRPRAG